MPFLTASAIPFIGAKIVLWVRGAPEPNALTLSRFLGVHMLILPVALVSLLAIHLLIIHQQGLADPKAKEDK